MALPNWIVEQQKEYERFQWEIVSSALRLLRKGVSGEDYRAVCSALERVGQLKAVTAYVRGETVYSITEDAEAIIREEIL